jgi:hypothetical protein
MWWGGPPAFLLVEIRAVPVFFSNNKRPPPDVRRAHRCRNKFVKNSLRVNIPSCGQPKAPVRGCLFRNAVSSETIGFTGDHLFI